MKADQMPTTRTKAADLTAEQRRIGNELLPRMSIEFVERNIPEALDYARKYDRARERFLHFAPVQGEGYVFDPKLFERALVAGDNVMNRIPTRYLNKTA